MRFLLGPRMLLTLMIMIGVLIVGMRVEDIWNTIAEGKVLAPHKALAETKDAASAAADAKPADAKPADATPAPAAADDTSHPSLVPPADEDVSPAEMEVLKQLSGRREELDKRARQLDTREALIKVAEQRVDQKIKEMETLKQQLQGMVNQASEQQAAQLDNLVKVYETMKPDDAAHIFETLDMPVVLNVIQRMKPKSSAPILAKMTPEKAKEITVALTKQDQLPQIK